MGGKYRSREDRFLLNILPCLILVILEGSIPLVIKLEYALKWEDRITRGLKL